MVRLRENGMRDSTRRKPGYWHHAVAALLTLALLGCSPSTEEVAANVKRSVEANFETNTQYQDFKLSVQSVTLVHEKDGRYQGMVTVVFEGEEHKLPISVLTDHTNTIWEIKPEAFAFIAQHELKKLQELFNPASEERKEAPQPKPIQHDKAKWAVQVASLSDKTTADKLVSELQRVGYDAYLTSTPKMNRVFVGPYEDRQQAKLIEDQLRSWQQISGFVVRYKPDLTGAELLIPKG